MGTRSSNPCHRYIYGKWYVLVKVATCPNLLSSNSSFSFVIFTALGQDSKMVVAGTACLDNTGTIMGQAIRLQKKGPLVAEKVMIDIITVSYHFGSLFLLSCNTFNLFTILFAVAGYGVL